MSTAFALLRALLAVLWFSTGVCVADCSAASGGEPHGVSVSSQGDQEQTHCTAHCESRTNAGSLHRLEKAQADLPDAYLPSVAMAFPPAFFVARAPPFSPGLVGLSSGLRDLRTVRLLI